MLAQKSVQFGKSCNVQCDRNHLNLSENLPEILVVPRLDFNFQTGLLWESQQHQQQLSVEELMQFISYSLTMSIRR